MRTKKNWGLSYAVEVVHDAIDQASKKYGLSKANRRRLLEVLVEELELQLEEWPVEAGREDERGAR